MGWNSSLLLFSSPYLKYLSLPRLSDDDEKEVTLKSLEMGQLCIKNWELSDSDSSDSFPQEGDMNPGEGLCNHILCVAPFLLQKDIPITKQHSQNSDKQKHII